MARGDLQRCLIVCPGNLVEQWQDELDRRFHLPFEIMTNDALEAARTGNWFLENPLAICRLDKLSRNEDVQAKLKQTDWDLIVCDEAHKMSATYFGNEVKYTKRYRLGPAALDADPPFPAADRHAAQRQGGGLPALHGPARRRPLRGQVPRRRPRGRHLRPDAPAGQGAASQVRRHAALPGAHRLHRQLRAFRRRGRPLQAGDRLRPRGIQPGRGPGKRGPQGHGRLRPDHPAAPPGLLARGHLPVAPPPPRTARKAAPRRAAPQARRARFRST